MAAAGRRDVGDVPAAEALEQLAELGRLALDVGRRIATSRRAARVEVERQHPPGTRAGVVDRHRGRLVRRLGGQRPGVPGRVGAAAVARDPDVRRTGEQGVTACQAASAAVRERPSGCRVLFHTRRVARGQC